MGAWGCGPLDNDNAADWFGGVFDETGFREAIAEGLASGHPDTVPEAGSLSICEWDEYTPGPVPGTLVSMDSTSSAT